MPKFPKTYYVKFEDGGSGSDYPNCYEAPIEAAELGETVTVGVYELVETMTVKGVAITNTAPRRKRRAA